VTAREAVTEAITKTSDIGVGSGCAPKRIDPIAAKLS
jgi:hypothetical protein